MVGHLFDCTPSQPNFSGSLQREHLSELINCRLKRFGHFQCQIGSAIKQQTSAWFVTLIGRVSVVANDKFKRYSKRQSAKRQSAKRQFD